MIPFPSRFRCGSWLLWWPLLLLSACKTPDSPPPETPNPPPTAAPLRLPPRLPKNPVAFTTSDRQLTIIFPGKITENTTVTPSPLGDLSIKNTIHVQEQEQRAFSVSVVKIPSPPEKINPNQVLTQAKQGIEADIGLKITKEEEFIVNGFLGLGVTMEDPAENLHSRGEIYLNHGQSTLYQVLVVSTQNDLETPEVNGFFESLTLGPTP